MWYLSTRPLIVLVLVAILLAIMSLSGCRQRIPTDIELGQVPSGANEQAVQTALPEDRAPTATIQVQPEPTRSDVTYTPMPQAGKTRTTSHHWHSPE